MNIWCNIKRYIWRQKGITEPKKNKLWGDVHEHSLVSHVTSKRNLRLEMGISDFLGTMNFQSWLTLMEKIKKQWTYRIGSGHFMVESYDKEMSRTQDSVTSVLQMVFFCNKLVERAAITSMPSMSYLSVLLLTWPGRKWVVKGKVEKARSSVHYHTHQDSLWFVVDLHMRYVALVMNITLL